MQARLPHGYKVYIMATSNCSELKVASSQRLVACTDKSGWMSTELKSKYYMMNVLENDSAMQLAPYVNE